MLVSKISDMDDHVFTSGHFFFSGPIRDHLHIFSKNLEWIGILSFLEDRHILSFLCRSTTLLIWLQTFLWIKRPLVAFARLWLQAKVHAYARTSERRVAKDFTTAGFNRKTATLLREVTPSRSDHPPPSPLAMVAACFFSSTSVL